MVTCVVKNCQSSSGNKSKATDGITFHRFPKDSERRNEWKKAINREGRWYPTDHSTVCSDHFTAEDFYETENGLRRLSVDALPSVNLDLCEPDPILKLSPIPICLNDTEEIIKLKKKVRRIEEIAEYRKRKIRTLWTDRDRLRKKLDEMKLMVSHLVEHKKANENSG